MVRDPTSKRKGKIVDLGLSGKTALVTGASEGIGRATALRFAREGANVVVCARREEPLRALEAEIEASGAGAVTVACDVTDPDAPAKVLEAARERWPGIDILVNNAGSTFAGQFLDTTDADWSAGIEMNLMSAVRFTRACLPWMLEQRWGRLIFVSSTYGRLGDPNHPIYGTTKGAMLNLSKSIAAAYAAAGVRSNCVLPGLTMTPLIEGNLQRAMERTGRTAEDLLKGVTDRWPIPVGRLGAMDETADAIAFLCSENAEWITGVSLPVDGGTIPVAV